MHRRARIVIPVVLALALIGWGALAVVRSRGGPPAGIAASGTVEATQVSIASRTPGRIARLHAAEGDAVRAGAPLVTMEGRELRAPLDQARAAVDAARARVAQAEAALALARRQVAAQVAQAEAAVEGARTRERQAAEATALTAAQAAQQVRQAEAALAAARQQAVAARAAMDRAAADLSRMEALYREGAVSGQQLDAARTAAATARAQFAAAQDAVAQAESGLRLARENLRQVRVREQEVAGARSQVAQAEAGLRLTRAGEEAVAQRLADLAAARAQLRQAEAALRALVVQEENLVVTAPIDGVVLAAHARAGEVVAAGAPIMTLADLRRVWIRLYVPLPQLGAVALGQRVRVTSDAFPGRTFMGTVTEIAQQAEFTPRNVQTPEERVRLVFAVKVTLPNPDRALWPGMPADAVILAGGGGRPVIAADGLTRRFGDTVAVDGVALRVERGELFGLLGPDGAGKTTLFRMLAGILEPSGGRAAAAGFDLGEAAEEARARIGYMPQAFALYGDLTVLENLRFAAEVFGVPRGEIGGRLERLLAFSRLGPFRHRRAEHLSGGMRQKLALAATLIHEPEVLLLDEPTTGVDPVSRRQFWEILSDLHLQGKTILVATPYLDEAERCARLALMHQGRILTVDTPEGLRSQMPGVVLEVSASPARPALAASRAMAEVRQAGLFGPVLHLVVPAPEVQPLIVERLRRAGIAVHQARVVEPSIEDVFVALLSGRP